MMPISRRVLVTLFVLTLTLTASVASAREATVTLDDGRVFTGEVVSDDGSNLVLSVSGIPMTLSHANIKSIDYQASTKDEYLERKAAIDPADLSARYDLAYWLFSVQDYPLAKKEIDELIAAAAASDDVPAELVERINLLNRVLTDRMKVQDAINNEGDPGRPPVADDQNADQPVETVEGGTVTLAEIANLPKLSDEQVNRIRIYEVDLSQRPNVLVPRDVLDVVFNQYAHDDRVPKGAAAQRRFRTRPGYEQLQLIFQLRARELYDKVTIREDPTSFKTFKSQVYRNYVLNYCGTTQCHGGPNAGGFVLIRDRATTDQTMYTNFYIMDQTSNKDGDIIDRDEPARSLLIQYGMVQAQANTPHPSVSGWTPKIRTREDTQYGQILEWVNQLYKPAPNYQIDYNVPRFKALSWEPAIVPEAPAEGESTEPAPADEGTETAPPDDPMMP